MSRRKAEMVLELIDRATRPGRRIMAMTKKLAKTTEMGNQKSARSSKLAARATETYRRATKALGRAQDRLQAKIKRSNSLIDRHRAKLRASARQMAGGAMGVGRAALLAGGMFTAYSGSMAAAGSALIGPAAQFERYAVQLKTLEGSSQKGRKAMEWIEGFATRTPLELNQVVEAYQQLKTYGMDPTNGSLMSLVDTMAASGKGAEHLSGLTLALGKSWTKQKLQGEEIMMLMERGVPVYDILGKKLGKTAEQIQKMGSAGKLGRKEIQILIDEMGRMNAGASDEMSKTWDGIISNILDSWTRFRRMVADAGVFDFMKNRLRGFLDHVNELDASGKLQQYADIIAKNILTGLEALWKFGQGAVRTWRAVYPWIQWSADALGGYRNLALALLAIPFRGVLFGAAAGFFQMGKGAFFASRALAGLGFGSIAKGALKGARATMMLLNPLNLVRGALIALRVAFIASGVGALVAGLAMAGVWIYNNWSGLKTFFASFGDAFMNALGPAAPLAERVVTGVKKVWSWVKQLVGPLDASSEQWASWGAAAGQAVADVVNFVVGLPGKVIGGLKSAWASVSSWTSNMWNGLKDAASTAWEGVKMLLLNYTPRGLIYQHWDGISAYFTGLWEGIKSAFSDAWSWIHENVIVPMQNAVSFMTDNKITRGFSGAKNFFFGGDEDPQTNARGGSYGPGWHLTGEQGPELKYETQSGYVAHNRALQRMVAMSREVRANTRRMPNFTRPLVAAGAVAASAVPAAASGAQYLTASNTGGGATSISMELNIQGNVDAQVMPDLKAEIHAAEARIMKALDAKARAAKRREHS